MEKTKLNVPQLGGAGAVGAMLTVFVDKILTYFGSTLTDLEWGFIAAGLGALIGYAVSSLPKPKARDIPSE